MARKSADDFLGKSDKLVEFEVVTLVQYEAAKDAYDAQDAETQAAIDLMVKTLHTYAEPETASGIEIGEDVLDQCLLVLAMQAVNDMALVDIRVGNYIYPANLCAACGSDV